MGFTKLFTDIVCSSIWNEDDKTRIVWITILAIKGSNQVARATIGGLAHQARVSTKDCAKAIEKLSSPDPDGLDQPEEGRRIRAVEHGWLVINGAAYEMRRDEDERREYMAAYMREYRRKRSVNNGKQMLADVEDVTNVSLLDKIRSDKIRGEEDARAYARDPRGEIVHPTHSPENTPRPPRRSSVIDRNNPPIRTAGFLATPEFLAGMKDLLRYFDEKHDRQLTGIEMNSLLNRFEHLPRLKDALALIDECIAKGWKNPVFPDEGGFK